MCSSESWPNAFIRTLLVKETSQPTLLTRGYSFFVNFKERQIWQKVLTIADVYIRSQLILIQTKKNNRIKYSWLLSKHKGT